MGLEGLLDPDDDNSQGSDRPITVIEITTGKKLVGEEAPLLSQLQEWLSQNPGWEIAETDDEDSEDEEEDEEEGKVANSCSTKYQTKGEPCDTSY